MRIVRGIPAIHLTFDDGPADSTVEILDVLAEHDAKATFFQVGRNVAARPEVTRRAHAEGHALGNHSWSHPNLRTDVDEAGVLRELSDTSDELERVTGVRPALFRPPYGQPWGRDDGTDATERRRVVRAHAASLGMTVLLWHVDTNDWNEDARTSSEIAARYDWDVFGVMLCNTEVERVRAYAEKLRKAVEDLDFSVGTASSVGEVTVTIAVAVFPDQARSEQELISTAEKTLRAAKASGPNRVVLATRG